MVQSAKSTKSEPGSAPSKLVQDGEELQRIVDFSSQFLFVFDADLRVLHVNRGVLHYTGLSLDDVRAGDFHQRVFHPHDSGRLRQREEAVAAGTAFESEERLLGADGKWRWFLLQHNPFADRSGTVLRWYVNGTDINDRKQTELLRAAEQRTLEMIADSATLEDVLDHLCRSIDAQISPSRTTILLMDPDGGKLWPAAGPGVPSEWTRAITPLPVRADVGLCGTAAFLKSRVIVPDFATEPTCWEQYREIALRSGIRAGWSQPILTNDDEVLGTFAIYSETSCVPTEADVALIETAGRSALIAIERQRAHAALAKAHEALQSERDRLQLLLDVQSSLVSNLDLDTLLTGLAASLSRVTDCDFVGLSLAGAPGEPLRQRFVHYCRGNGNLREGMLVPLHGSASGKAFRTGQLVSLDHLSSNSPDPEIYGTPEGQEFYDFLLREGVPSGYFLPLVRGKDVIAVMQLTKYAGKVLKVQEAQFLTALANQLSAAVSNALQHEAVVASSERLAREQVYLREEIMRSSMFEEIVGSSKCLRNILAQVMRVAPTDSTVLIQGETGTGKELLAHAIHNRSKRANRPFVRMNCAAIPPSLIASELFGHEKGAFTGALQRRVGRFESADGGTVFLDEVGEIPHDTQISLLRILQEREFERVGGNQPIRVDVRVLAATNRDLQEAVEEGRFRKDLFYRLNVFPITVPPLRERGDDIPLLVEYLIDRYAKQMGKQILSIGRSTIELFQNYDWPGNVRELQNVIERAVILCDGQTFSVDPTWLRPLPSPAAADVAMAADLAQREKSMIENALRESAGQISGAAGAAAKLGMPRQTLESKIRKLRIDRYRFKSSL